MSDKNIEISNLSKANIAQGIQYIFRISYSENKQERLPFEDSMIINEFITMSECLEDNSEWLENGNSLEVILTKTSYDTQYRIEKV